MQHCFVLIYINHKPYLLSIILLYKEMFFVVKNFPPKQKNLSTLNLANIPYNVNI